MEPLLSLDLVLVMFGIAILLLAVRRCLRRRGTLTTSALFFLSVGTLAAAVIDVGLSQHEKNFRRSLVENADFLRVGSLAPDFSLPRLGDGQTIRLGDVLGRKPVCLVLSSFS